MEHRHRGGVGLPLEDLVAQDQLVAKLGGHQFGEHPVILVGVAPMRGEHHVGRTGRAKRLQRVLHPLPVRRCAPVGHVEDRHGHRRTRTERRERGPLLGLTFGTGAAEHQRMHTQAGVGL
jgi:hypothetical protein